MQKFAALCAIAVSAAYALGLEKGTKAMKIDNWEADVQSLP